MARRKKDMKLKKVPNILDSYIKFRDLDDEEFIKTFGGTKETIINSWLYLLYVELKQQFEEEQATAVEGGEAEVEDAPIEVEDEKTNKRKERRQRKRKGEKGEVEAEPEVESQETDPEDSGEDLYGIKEDDARKE
jgi:hypothetical protein